MEQFSILSKNQTEEFRFEKFIKLIICLIFWHCFIKLSDQDVITLIKYWIYYIFVRNKIHFKLSMK